MIILPRPARDKHRKNYKRRLLSLADDEAEELEAGEGIAGYGHAQWHQLQRIMEVQPGSYRHLQGMSEVEQRQACQFYIAPSRPRATVFDYCGCCPK
jgi:hypothetical protein